MSDDGSAHQRFSAESNSPSPPPRRVHRRGHMSSGRRPPKKQIAQFIDDEAEESGESVGGALSDIPSQDANLMSDKEDGSDAGNNGSGTNITWSVTPSPGGRSESDGDLPEKVTAPKTPSKKKPVYNRSTTPLMTRSQSKVAELATADRSSAPVKSLDTGGYKNSRTEAMQTVPSGSSAGTRPAGPIQKQLDVKPTKPKSKQMAVPVDKFDAFLAWEKAQAGALISTAGDQDPRFKAGPGKRGQSNRKSKQVQHAIESASDNDQGAAFQDGLIQTNTPPNKCKVAAIVGVQSDSDVEPSFVVQKPQKSAIKKTAAKRKNGAEDNSDGEVAIEPVLKKARQVPSKKATSDIPEAADMEERSAFNVIPPMPKAMSKSTAANKKNGKADIPPMPESMAGGSGSKKKAAQKGKGKAEEEVVLETEDTLPPVTKLPALCEVNNVDLQDPVASICYVNTPNLRLCALLSWNPVQGNGNYMLSNWNRDSPSMDETTCWIAYNFVRLKHYINLSRIDPRLLRAVSQNFTGGKKKYYLEIDGKTAICVSMLASVKSSLSEISTVSGGSHENIPRLKYLTGIPHCQEFERFVSCMGMVFHQKVMKAQIDQDVITFSTRAEKKDASPKSSPTKRPMGIRSGGVTSGSARRYTASTDVLNAEDEIPIYDGTGNTFDLSVNADNIENVLKRYPRDEVPAGSCVLVGYTVTQFIDGKNVPNVGFNIMWVVVIGEPADA